MRAACSYAHYEHPRLAVSHAGRKIDRETFIEHRVLGTEIPELQAITWECSPLVPCVPNGPADVSIGEVLLLAKRVASLLRIAPGPEFTKALEECAPGRPDTPINYADWRY
jgi:hypothetical protein